MNHHHTNRVIVAATAIAIAFSACGDETTAPGAAVELPAPDAAVIEAHTEFADGMADNVQVPAPDVHRNETERFERIQPPVVDAETRRFERLQPTVEVGRSQRLVEESIQDSLDARTTSATTYPAQQLAV